ncbi:DUF5666 domain-containing protein [uncultured Methylobacterium sp.]|uniref:DUF5666 domain-containing protein n=1 Tax=uncultured Methylobacterium sp. TaxID=157278 RepID=UPI0035CB8DD4
MRSGRGPDPNRRRVLRWLAGAAGLLLPGRARPQEAPRDQGIGGTGARPADGPAGEDRGIGGTGMIGTIRRFGSIVVNDLRIAYPADVAVRIDGAPARGSDLRIGHVVRCVAHAEAGGLSTRRIDVTSEVVGPVEAVARGGMTVLGQRVSTAGMAGGWAVGDWVAVSGLRRPDGVVVASLIEPRSAGPAHVAGPVRRDAEGRPRIGALRLDGAGALVGGRAALTGEAAAGVLRHARATEAGPPFPPGLARVSVEAYVGRSGGRLNLGSGLPVSGAAAAIPRRGSVRAVLTLQPDADGRLTVERLRVDGRPAPGPANGREAPRFEHRPDRIDPRGLPGQGGAGQGFPGQGPDGPGRPGLAPGGHPGTMPGLDTRPDPGGFGPGGHGGLGLPGGPGGLNGPGGFGGGPGGPGGFGGLGGPGGGRR